MSKQSEAKKFQGYNPKPPKRICSECHFYASEFEKRGKGWAGTWTEEVNKRCLRGGFAVKKTASCEMFVTEKEHARLTEELTR